jgi:hypothetical protein
MIAIALRRAGALRRARSESQGELNERVNQFGLIQYTMYYITAWSGFYRQSRRRLRSEGSVVSGPAVTPPPGCGTGTEGSAMRVPMVNHRLGCRSIAGDLWTLTTSFGKNVVRTERVPGVSLVVLQPKDGLTHQSRSRAVGPGLDPAGESKEGTRSGTSQRA